MRNFLSNFGYVKRWMNQRFKDKCKYHNTVCPRSPDPFHIISYDINWVKTCSTKKIRLTRSSNYFYSIIDLPFSNLIKKIENNLWQKMYKTRKIWAIKEQEQPVQRRNRLTEIDKRTFRNTEYQTKKETVCRRVFIVIFHEERGALN